MRALLTVVCERVWASRVVSSPHRPLLGACPCLRTHPLLTAFYQHQIARETGVDLTALAGKGSGPGGRILRGDVSAFGVPGAAPKAVAAAVTAPATPSTVSTAPAPVQAFGVCNDPLPACLIPFPSAVPLPMYWFLVYFCA